VAHTTRVNRKPRQHARVHASFFREGGYPAFVPPGNQKAAMAAALSQYNKGRDYPKTMLDLEYDACFEIDWREVETPEVPESFELPLAEPVVTAWCPTCLTPCTLSSDSSSVQCTECSTKFDLETADAIR